MSSAGPSEPINLRRPAFVAAAILGTGAYLGLAMLGAGGAGPFFSAPARVALTIVLIALTIASLFTRGNLSAGRREDRGNRWVIAAFGVLGFLLAFVPAYAERRGFLTFGGDGVRWLGVGLFAVGGILRLWPVFVLGNRFSGLVAIQEGHELVTDGIYRVIRHPSYLGLMVSSLGWALAFRSGAGLVLVALLLVPLIARIRAEEQLLAETFGAPYETYRARTRRLLPGLW